MTWLEGMRIRMGEKSGLLESVTETEVNVRWLEKSMLDSKTESVSFLDPRFNQIELLTLTHGWTSMADASNANKGTARSLVDDLRSILAEEFTPDTASELAEDVSDVEGVDAVEEAAEVDEASDTGKSLEKKAREKRKQKKGGGGHNPFKTKSRLGPGPRNGSNSQTKAWKCACTTPYKCNCKNKKTGRTKVVRIKRAYKKDYNVDYKRWRRQQKF